jgi:hypothetical protein
VTDETFVAIVEGAFVAPLAHLGFSLQELELHGRFDLATFVREDYAIHVSYEPGDEAVFIIVFRRKNGVLSDIDNPSETVRLSDLNERYMRFITPQERANCDAAFRSVQVTGRAEQLMVKGAKELSLVLPRYLADFRQSAP